MIQVLGSVIVLACVLGGFVLEGGHLLALWHPTEILIIVGAALGAFLTSNPPKVSKLAFQGALSLPKGARYRRDDYVTLLKLVYDILVKMRKDGVAGHRRRPREAREERALQEIPEDPRQTIT